MRAHRRFGDGPQGLLIPAAAYEAHMTNAQGERVTVYVNAQFEVVSVESGRSARGTTRAPGPPHRALAESA